MICDAYSVIGAVVLAVFTIGIHTELQQFKKLFRLLHISIQVSERLSNRSPKMAAKKITEIVIFPWFFWALGVGRGG